MTIVLDDATLAETARRWASPSYKVGPRVHPRVPDGWADEPYTRFGVEPLAPTIGAVITGVSLADPIDDELFAQLNRTLLEDERSHATGTPRMPRNSAAVVSGDGPGSKPSNPTRWLLPRGWVGHVTTAAP